MGGLSKQYAQRGKRNNNVVLTFRTTDPFKCFIPVNLQSHRFTCDRPYGYPERVNGSAAIENMQNAWFVGIVEAYQESWCLFLLRLGLPFPESCNCDSPNPEHWKKMAKSLAHKDHGVHGFSKE